MAAIEADSEVKANALIARLDEVNKKYRHDSRFELSVQRRNDKVAKRLDDLQGEWTKTLDVTKKGTAADIQRGTRARSPSRRTLSSTTSPTTRTLILDPDLDSYWLMDIAIRQGPRSGVDAATAVSTALLGLQGDRTDWIYGIHGYADRCEPEHRLHRDQSISRRRSATPRTSVTNPKVPLLKPPFDDLKASVHPDHGRQGLAHPSGREHDQRGPGSGRSAGTVVARRRTWDHCSRHRRLLFDKARQALRATTTSLEGASRIAASENYKGERTKGVLFTILGRALCTSTCSRRSTSTSTTRSARSQSRRPA